MAFESEKSSSLYFRICVNNGSFHACRSPYFVVNVSDFAQNFKVPFLGYIQGGNAIFFYFDHCKGLFGHLKNRFFSRFKICKIHEF